MPENKNPNASTEAKTDNKLESTQEHARQALQATKKAAKTTFEVGKEQAASAYKESKEHVTAAAQNIGQVAEEKFGALRGQVRDLTEDYRTKVQQTLSDAGTKVRTLQDDSESYIRENPLQAVGIAAVVGFIIGLLIRR